MSLFLWITPNYINDCREKLLIITSQKYTQISPEGGEFVITNSKYTVTESLQPSCGKIVGFSAETFHGVRAVEKGDRYAIGNWLINCLIDW